MQVQGTIKRALAQKSANAILIIDDSIHRVNIDGDSTTDGENGKMSRKQHTQSAALHKNQEIAAVSGVNLDLVRCKKLKMPAHQMPTV